MWFAFFVVVVFLLLFVCLLLFFFLVLPVLAMTQLTLHVFGQADLGLLNLK